MLVFLRLISRLCAVPIQNPESFFYVEINKPILKYMEKKRARSSQNTPEEEQDGKTYSTRHHDNIKAVQYWHKDSKLTNGRE